MAPLQIADNQKFYAGKVRDVYEIDDLIIMIVSNRISAFDVILPSPIPYKGQILNQIADRFLKATKEIVPNWLITSPHPNISIGLKCQPYPIEMVVRGYLTGHAWREDKSGKRSICGVSLPDNLKEHDKLPSPIITPTTKAKEGHDMDISKEAIIAQGIIKKDTYELLEKNSLDLFRKGMQMAEDRGLILVDTKYEFGKYKNTIYLIDEIHTPDSSRYFIKEGYNERQQKGFPQKQLSKEFVREWLIENNFQGKEGQTVPVMNQERIEKISTRYIELYEHITGDNFVPSDENIDVKTIQDTIEHIKSNKSLMKTFDSHQ